MFESGIYSLLAAGLGVNYLTLLSIITSSEKWAKELPPYGAIAWITGDCVDRVVQNLAQSTHGWRVAVTRRRLGRGESRQVFENWNNSEVGSLDGNELLEAGKVTCKAELLKLI